MKMIPLTLIVFGIILIVFPEIIDYLIGAFFIFLGINMLFINMAFSKWNKQEEYIKFGKYKIYR